MGWAGGGGPWTWAGDGDRAIRIWDGTEEEEEGRGTLGREIGGIGGEETDDTGSLLERKETPLPPQHYVLAVLSHDGDPQAVVRDGHGFQDGKDKKALRSTVLINTRLETV